MTDSTDSTTEPSSSLQPAIKRSSKRDGKCWRWLWRLFCFLLGFLLLLGGTLHWLIATEHGLRTAVQTAEKYLPLQINEVHGSLWHGFQLKQIQFQQGEQQLRAQQFNFAWRSDLLWQEQRLVIEQIALQGIQIQLPPSRSSAPKSKPYQPIKSLDLSSIRLPLPLEIQQLSLTDLQFKQGNMELQLNRLQFAAQGIKQQFQLNQVIVESNLATLGLDLIQLNSQTSRIDWKNLHWTFYLQEIIKKFSLPELPVTEKPQIIAGSSDCACDINQQVELTLKLSGLVQGNLRVKVKEPLRLDFASDQLLKQIVTQNEANWWLQLPELSRIISNLSGYIMTQGGMHDGKLSGEIQTNNVKLAEFQLDKAAIIWRLTNELNDKTKLIIKTDQVRFKRPLTDQLSLELTGTPAKHQIVFNTQVKNKDYDMHLNLKANGELSDDFSQWTGQIHDLDVPESVMGKWKLQNPAQLIAGDRQIVLQTPLCFINGKASICAKGHWKKSEGAAGNLIMQQITPELVKKWIPSDIKLQTALNLNLDATYQNSGALSVDSALHLAEGSFYTKRHGRTINIPINAGKITLKATEKQADSEIDLGLGTLLKINGKVSLVDPLKTGKLAGKIELVVPSITPFAEAAPMMADVSGMLNSELTLAGNLSDPDVKGFLELKDGAFSVPQTNVNYQALQLKIDRKNLTDFVLNGKVNSGAGQLQLTGDFSLRTKQVGLRIQGANFPVMATEQLKVNVSPQLKLDYQNSRTTVTGQIGVPLATYDTVSQKNAKETNKEKKSTTVIKPSEDVKIKQKGKKLRPPAQQKSTIVANVTVELGDNVSVAVAGFDAKISGKLQVEQKPGFPTTGTGALGIEKGDYEIYGQKLTITRGKVLFAGGAIDNPGLDFQAERSLENNDGSAVSVGVRVQGSARRPSVNFFSKPTMPQASIVSYLLLGRAPDSRSGAESALLPQALAATGNSPLTEIQKASGLDTFGVESGSGMEDAAFVIGKYLTPELYVSYGVGLFDQSSEFSLRYQMKKWLQFKLAASTEGSSADILYSKEKDTLFGN